MSMKKYVSAWELSRGFRWVGVSNWTLYMDISVPFTKYVVVLDVGRHGTLGYRYKESS